jgi:hypothetical protein
LKLLLEFDHDGNLKLDIDEFVTLMSSGSDISFRDENSKNTFMKIT